jgi:lipopolysaccharide heptosyltransferase II
MCYNRRVRVSDPDMHAVDRYLLVAEALGLVIERPVRFNVHVPDAARQAIATRLGAINPSGRPLAALAPGSQWASKRWPAEQFASLADRLVEQGARVVLLGAPGEKPLVERIRAMMLKDAASLAGETTLPELAALFERAGVVVANDSGPMHLAVALERPVVALYGPTSEKRTGPYGGAAVVLKSDRPCAPCYEPDCEDPECMRDITVARALEAISGLGFGG